MHDHDKTLKERLSTITREGGLLIRDLVRWIGLAASGKNGPTSGSGRGRVQNPAAMADKEALEMETAETKGGEAPGDHSPAAAPVAAAEEEEVVTESEAAPTEAALAEAEPEAEVETSAAEGATSPEGYRAGQVWRPAAEGKQARKVTAITEEMGEYYIVWEPPEGGKANRIKETSFTRWVRREKAETD